MTSIQLRSIVPNRTTDVMPKSSGLGPALAREYHAGATIATLAARFGLTYYATRECLLAEGVRLRPAGPTPAPIPPGMADAYREGSTIPELAERHGLSFGVARRMLLSAGVTLRAPGQRLPVGYVARSASS